MQDLICKKLFVQCVTYRQEPALSGSKNPVGHGLPRNGQTEPAQLLFLSVKRQRKHIFAVHDLRQQTGRYDPAARQKRRRNGAFLHGNTGFLFFALTPAPGFAALLDRRPAFRAFVDWRVRVVPLRVVVPHPAFAAGAFLPRDVARWRKAHPTVRACQLIRHDAIPPCVFLPFYHTGKGSRLFDAYLRVE